MRAWLLRAPWWALSLVLGTSFALVRILLDRILDDESWTESAVTGVFGGLVFGLAVGPVMARLNRRSREELGTDDPDVVRRAARAARWGQVPEDPVEREQARRMALVMHEQALRQRPWLLGVCALMVVAAVVLSVVAGNAILLLLVAVPFGLVLGLHLLLTRRFERRAELLGDPAA